MKYLKFFPKPILDDISDSNCVPFIGAGFSRNAKLPKGQEVPLWDELGHKIANYMPDYDYINPIDALSTFEREYSRPRLVEELFKLLHVDTIQPAETHKAFCQLLFPIVCTTNFDFLLEDGYRTLNQYCRPILEEDQLTISISSSNINLLKLHGDLNHPQRLIMTEDDYDLFIERYPLISTYISNLLISKSALFIGYSLDDPDLRQIWQIISDRLGRNRRFAYTILFNASTSTISRYERRKIKVINIVDPKSDYPNMFINLFNELNEHWLKSALSESTSTTEDAFTQLSLPKDASSKICLFLTPDSLISYYRNNIFPIVEKYGFIAISPDQILIPGDNIMVKTQALIERSELVFVDISSKNTLMELGFAMSKYRIDDYHLIIVIEEGTIPQIDIQKVIYLERPKNIIEESDKFETTINQYFRDFYLRMEKSIENEPRRLLNKKEYRAAAISAISLLETRIRQKISDKTNLGYAPIKMILKELEKNNIMDNKYIKNINKWYIYRNKAIHEQGEITKDIAEEIVYGIYQIIEDINNRRD